MATSKSRAKVKDGGAGKDGESKETSKKPEKAASKGGGGKGGGGKPPEADTSGFGDTIRLGETADVIFKSFGTVGVVALGVALFWGFSGDRKAFLHAYLVSFMWILTIGLGALWWVTLQHLVNAKWSIVVRRVGEIFAANMSTLAVLALPIVVPTALGSSDLYIWASSEKMHADHLLHHKLPYLNVPFFVVRFFLYFAFWAALSQYLFKKSVQQDQANKPELVTGMARVSAPSMIAIALTLTFCAIDFMMTLEPAWFSTIFGVYYFASCVIAVHATLILTLIWLQSRGIMKKSITVEHYHDLGKMLFAFTVFWAYIGFSQFMLIWYANVPEETFWYKKRIAGDWGMMAWVLVFGHFVLPFFGLLSRHIKRNKKTLGFWAVWMLVMVWIDMFWLVKPALGGAEMPVGLLDILCFVGVTCTFIASVAFNARNKNLVPVKDPRLARSLAFENF
jgi:hypothetical protein